MDTGGRDLRQASRNNHRAGGADKPRCHAPPGVRLLFSILRASASPIRQRDTVAKRPSDAPAGGRMSGRGDTRMPPRNHGTISPRWGDSRGALVFSFPFVIGRCRNTLHTPTTARGKQTPAQKSSQLRVARRITRKQLECWTTYVWKRFDCNNPIAC